MVGNIILELIQSGEFIYDGSNIVTKCIEYIFHNDKFDILVSSEYIVVSEKDSQISCAYNRDYQPLVAYCEKLNEDLKKEFTNKLKELR